MNVHCTSKITRWKNKQNKTESNFIIVNNNLLHKECILLKQNNLTHFATVAQDQNTLTCYQRNKVIELEHSKWSIFSIHALVHRYARHPQNIKRPFDSKWYHKEVKPFPREHHCSWSNPANLFCQLIIGEYCFSK